MDEAFQQQIQPGVSQQYVHPQPVYYATGIAPDQANTNIQPAQVAAPAAQTAQLPVLNAPDWQFWKGALLGAAVTLLVTNESIQKGAMKMISKVGAAAQSGVEEIKEKFEDAKAEAEAEVSK